MHPSSCHLAQRPTGVPSGCSNADSSPSLTQPHCVILTTSPPPVVESRPAGDDSGPRSPRRVKSDCAGANHTRRDTPPLDRGDDDHGRQAAILPPVPGLGTKCGHLQSPRATVRRRYGKCTTGVLVLAQTSLLTCCSLGRWTPTRQDIPMLRAPWPHVHVHVPTRMIPTARRPGGLGVWVDWTHWRRNGQRRRDVRESKEGGGILRGCRTSLSPGADLGASAVRLLRRGLRSPWEFTEGGSVCCNSSLPGTAYLCSGVKALSYASQRRHGPIQGPWPEARGLRSRL